MGTWVVIHYGTNYSGSEQDGVCGAKVGGPESRSVLTWRPYEIETDEHLGGYPEGSKVCPKCREIIVTSRIVEEHRERRQMRAVIDDAKRRIPILWANRNWGKIAALAYKAADAKENLRRMKR